MVNALPQALGAQAAMTERQVIALSGDGGLAMLLEDLVFNNGTLGFVELEMKAAGWLAYRTDLVNRQAAGIRRYPCGISVEACGKGDEVIDVAKTNLLR
jgi:pyruvate dehydrogenase (quinone)